MNRAWIEFSEQSQLNFEEKLRCFTNNILNNFTYLINQGKVFKINNEIKTLIKKTKSNLKYESNLPFKQVVIDFGEIEQEQNSWFGIIIEECKVNNFKIKNKIKVKDKVLKIFMVGRDNNDGESIYLWDYLSDEGISEDYMTHDDMDLIFNNDKKKREEFVRKIFNISLKFINLINHPEVELIEKSNNIIRKLKNKENKFGRPDEITINKIKKLKKYIYNIQQKNKKGQKTWILHYIKGQGELKNKSYYLGERERCWINERKMKELIQLILPEKKLSNNNRTILNGLEIDCYIPDLKIGFEYNGIQHYIFPNFVHRSEEDFKKQVRRDQYKIDACNMSGVYLISIPYTVPHNAIRDYIIYFLPENVQKRIDARKRGENVSENPPSSGLPDELVSI